MIKDLTSFDNEIKNTMESIFNINLTEQQWTQASLPISSGGIGIRKLKDICLPAFISSIHGVDNLVSRILHIQDKIFISHMDEALNNWSIINGLSMPDIKIYQKDWDSFNIKKVIDTELNFDKLLNIARLQDSKRYNATNPICG